MKDNHLIKTLLLPALVIAGLLLLYYIPEITLFGEEPLRKVDILSDVKKTTYTQSEAEKLIAEAEAERKKLLGKDCIFPGVTPIEDFQTSSDPSTGRGNRMMDFFYSALNKAKQLDRPVRIAYFGDSFIGGDILTCDLRDMLQTRFGGCGVGTIDLVSPASRPTVVQTDQNLTSHLPTKLKNFKAELQGMNSVYSTCEGVGKAKITGSTYRYKQHTDKWDTSLLYFRPTNKTIIKCAINGRKAKELYSGKDSKLQVVKTDDGEIRSVEWTIEGKGSTFFFAANEGKNGVIIDNFGIVSAKGSHLQYIPLSTLQEFAAVREYDLIIFQYGLNVTNDAGKYTSFSESFDKVLANFHKAWPKASLMMVSVSDRCKGNNGGKPTTMKGIEELVIAQRNIARKNKIAFWNLFSAMGGRGGIAKMVEEGDAAKDFTHMTYSGGKKLADKLYNALMNGLYNYNVRQKANTKINEKVNNIKEITR